MLLRQDFSLQEMSKHVLTFDSLASPTVAIVVGEEAAVFHVHENVIRTQSPFFAAALSENRKEGSDMRVCLPEDRPEIVELYIQWLYSHKFFINWSTTSAASDELDGRHPLSEYYTLAYLYVFGEKCCDITFKNAVIDAFVRRTKKKIDNKVWFPAGGVVDIIYEGTPTSSPLRRLMIDGHLRRGHAGWVDDPTEALNKDFLRDLIRAMYADVEKTGKTFTDLDKVFDATKYHENDGSKTGQGAAMDTDA